MITLEEGKSYTVRVTCTNASRKAGVPAPATLTVRVISSLTLAIGDPQQYAFAPGETRSFDFALTAPAGQAGQEGWLIAEITSPVGITLAQAQESIAISTPAPVKLGSVFWANPWVYDPHIGGTNYAYVTLTNIEEVRDAFNVTVILTPVDPSQTMWTQNNFAGVVGNVTPGSTVSAVCGPGPIAGTWPKYVPSFDCWVTVVVQSVGYGYGPQYSFDRVAKVTISQKPW